MAVTPAPLSGRERLTYLAFVAVLPLLGGVIGVDGGPVFQIIASQTLGLDAREVGLAVGLGALSIPVQVWAGRIPLRLAHRNLRLFVWSMAIMCLVFAAMIVSDWRGPSLVAGVIALAVLAEIAVSVLFATSFQPLLSTTVSHAVRQRLNGPGRALGGILAVGLVALVSAVGSGNRGVIVALLAAVGLLLASAASLIRQPSDPFQGRSGSTQRRPHVEPQLRMAIIAIGVSVVPAWPFFVTYVGAVDGAGANVGQVGAAVIVGGLGAGAMWRPTSTGLLRRARWAASVMLVGSLALIMLDRPLNGSERAVTVLIVLAASAAGTIVRLALLEVVHLYSSTEATVATLTMLDVIASTSMQMGFLAAGYLIDWSVDSSWLLDPYQLSLVIGAFALVVVLTQVSEPNAA